MKVRIYLKTISLLAWLLSAFDSYGVEARFYDEDFWSLDEPVQYFEDKENTVSEADILNLDFEQ